MLQMKFNKQLATEMIHKKSSSIDLDLAYQGFDEEPVPSAIFDAIVSTKIARVMRYTKIGLLLLTGFLTAIATMHAIRKDTSDLNIAISVEQMAVSSHTTFAKDPAYPVRVGANDVNHLENWITHRLGKNVRVRTLSNVGYTLLGGNIVPDGDRIAAQIVYENQNQERISLFIRHSSGADLNIQARSGRHKEFNWICWYDGNGQQVIVSEVDQSQLRKVFESF